MCAYLVLVYGGCSSPPILHLITARDDAIAAIFADLLLSETRQAVGVRVTRWEGGEIYARGVVPTGAAREEAAPAEGNPVSADKV